MESHSLDIFWIIVSAGLVFIMQAGFLCLESGCTRTKNSINVAVKNLTDFGLSIMLYWMVGFGLMFGLTSGGLVGSSGFFVNTGSDAPWLTAFFIFQAMFCGTSVTIVSGAVAERMSYKGYLVIAIFVSAFVYPVFGHWAWGGALEGDSGWLGSMGFIDFAGSTVVHSVGGWVALAAIIILGPRLGRFEENGGSRPIPGQSLPLAMLGALILCFGWIGFNGGSTLAWSGEVPSIVTNTILAASSGMIMALIIGWQRNRYPEIKCCMNGLLAGLVAITANCHIVSAPEALIIGAVGAIFMALADELLERWRLDDVVGSFAVHSAAGVWGTLAVALFGDTSAFAQGYGRLEQLGVQALGVCVCAIFSFGSAYVILFSLRNTIRFRVSAEDELKGLNATEHNTTTEHLDLLREMESQSRHLDLSRRVSVEPFTEVGQIAARYNQVLESLEQTVARNELIIRDTKDGILTCSKEGRILGANQGAESMFGYDAKELGLMSIWALLGSEVDANFASFDEFIEYAGGSENALSNLKLSGLKKSGDRFPIELEAVKGIVGNQEVRTVRMRDRSVSENYQQQLKVAKDEAERTSEELQEKVRQIEAFNSLAIDRESRMMELKQEINQLCADTGKEPPYQLAGESDDRN